MCEHGGLPANYRYKTAPLGRQRDVIERSWREKRWALLCRPGTGKTKISLDTAAMLYSTGAIEAMIIVAPANVERQWVDDQIPIHMPDFVPVKGGVYTARMGKRAHDKLIARLRSTDMGLRVLSLGFEALLTPRGKELAHLVANTHRTLLVVDESHRAANSKSSTWKALKPLAEACPYVRIATGTLVTQDPFAVWAQMELLGHGILGYTTLSSFKSMYAELLPEDNGLVRRIARDFKERTGRQITPQIVAKDPQGRPTYRNLGHLRRLLEKHASFLRLEDVAGTEPTVLVSTRVINLTPQQEQLYTALEDVGIVGEGEDSLTVDGGLALALRLAQITGGFMPTDADKTALPIPGGNPKLETVLEIAEELGSEKLIVWCRFHAELDAVAAALSERYGANAVAQYHGGIDNKERQKQKRAFMEDSQCRFFVAQVRAGGTGLDGLQRCANYMIFYSNEYAFFLREQSVARLARTGGCNVVNVIDILAANTVDIDVARCMQTGQDVHIDVLARGKAQRIATDTSAAGV
jgi:hypothetical protein